MHAVHYSYKITVVEKNLGLPEKLTCSSLAG